MIKKILIGIFLFTGITSNAQKKYEPNWESIDSRQIAPWFKDAKLGVFIHLGPYSVPAWSPKGTYSEWYQHWLQDKDLFGNGDFTGSEVYDHHVRNYGTDFSYYNFGEMLKTKEFDANEWVNLLEKSGAKYVIFTSKHHDGYCLWPSKQANQTWGRKWTSADIGPKRDLLKELEVAVKKTDIKFGTYYSLYEWYNPLWLKDPERYALEHMHPQFKDMIENYKPDLIWSDGDWELEYEKWHTPELLTWLFNESAVKEKVVINDRWGKGIRFNHGGYHTTEFQSGLDTEHPWEETRAIGFSFGYNKNENSWDYAESKAIIYMLLNIVSSGGNLLLGVGPNADGKIPPIMQERLLDLGAWLKVNGEAIYGTSKWIRTCQWSEDGKKDWLPEKYHYLPTEYILKQTVDQQPGYAVREMFFTQKNNDLYAILPKFPKDSFTLRDYTIQPKANITMLGTNLNLTYEQKGKDVIIYMPRLTIEELPCLHAWTIKISPSE